MRPFCVFLPLLCLLVWTAVPALSAPQSDKVKAYNTWMRAFIPAGVASVHWHQTMTERRELDGKPRTATWDADGWYTAPDKVRHECEGAVTLAVGGTSTIFDRNGKVVRTSKTTMAFWMSTFFRPDEDGCRSYLNANTFIAAKELAGAVYNGVQCRVYEVSYKASTWVNKPIGPSTITIYVDTATGWVKSRVIKTQAPDSADTLYQSVRDYDYNAVLDGSLFQPPTPAAK